MPAPLIGIPYRLAFAGRHPSNPRLPMTDAKGTPGTYGDAGWTVWHVTPAQLIGALSALPRAAWMPGTFRLAADHGIAV